jgi:hypothetical protein
MAKKSSQIPVITVDLGEVNFVHKTGSILDRWSSSQSFAAPLFIGKVKAYFDCRGRMLRCKKPPISHVGVTFEIAGMHKNEDVVRSFIEKKMNQKVKELQLAGSKVVVIGYRKYLSCVPVSKIRNGFGEDVVGWVEVSMTGIA